MIDGGKAVTGCTCGWDFGWECMGWWSLLWLLVYVLFGFGKVEADWTPADRHISG